MIRLSKTEMDNLEDSLDDVLEDTINCWIQTRINGGSAVLDSGNVSVKLLRTFDQIAEVCSAAQIAVISLGDLDLKKGD